MFKRIKAGWNLARECWRVLRLDKELMVFPVLSSIGLLLVLASFAAPLWSGVLSQATEEYPVAMTDPILLAAYFAFYFACSFVIFYFNSALIACALIRFKGGDPTVRDGLRAASARLGPILKWSALSAVVGVFLGAVEERSGALGKFIVGLLGAGWAIASYFAIPVLVTENIGPIDALKRSASIIRKTWGETLTAEVGMSALIFAAILPAIAIAAGGIFALETSAALGALLILLGLLWFLGAILAGFTLDAILTSALYLYARDGQIPQNFDNRLAENAFTPRRNGDR